MAKKNTTKPSSPAVPNTGGALQKLKSIISKPGFDRKFFRCVSAAGILASVAIVLYYIILPAKGEFHADCTDTLMWAVASHESGQIISDTFYYACFLPFGGQLLMLPFIGLCGEGMVTHTIGMILFALLFSWALVAFTRSMKWDAKWSLTAVFMVLMTLSLSKKLREIFWGHIIYYSLGIFFMLVGLTLINRVIQEGENKQVNKKRFIVYTVLTFVWVMLCSLNQIESLTIFVVPALAGVFGEAFFSYKEKVRSRKNGISMILFIAMAVATAVGYIAGLIIIGDNEANYADTYSTFTDVANWSDHIRQFFTDWITLLGIDAKLYDKIIAPEGIMTLIKFIYTLVLLICPVVITIKYKKQSRPVQTLIVTHWTMTMLIMMGYVLGQLSVANWRLSPIVCTSVILTVALCQWTLTQTNTKRNIAIILIPSLIVCFSSAFSVLGLPTDYKETSGLYKAVKLLEDNNQTYGYATFWNANSVTAISNAKVKCRNINMDENGQISPFKYQADSQWFEAQPDQNQYFLLMTDAEYQSVVSGAPAYISQATQILSGDGYTVAVFNQNLF